MPWQTAAMPPGRPTGHYAKPDPQQDKQYVRPPARFAKLAAEPIEAAPAARRARRGRVFAALLSVLVLLGFGAVVVVVRPGPVAGWFGERAAVPTPSSYSPEPVPSPVLMAAEEALEPTAAGVRAAIDGLVTGAGLGGKLGVSVVDMTTGTSLYAAGPEDPVTPASTTKLATAVTALVARGPLYRIPTRVVAGAAAGEVVLVGGGDPTLAVGDTGTYAGAARLETLAAQVRKALGGVTPTRVTVDATLFTGPVYGPGWDGDIRTAGYGGPITALMTDGGRIDPGKASGDRYAKPDIAAGKLFAKILGVPASAVRSGTAPEPPSVPDTSEGASPQGVDDDAGAGSATLPNPAPAPGTQLGQVTSPPLLRLVEIMLSQSDNVVAEALARQVALAKGESASFAGAQVAVDTVLGELGLAARESTLYDGSGLSRQNKITPSMLTDLLVLAASGKRPELAGVFSGLPVAGWSGTLADRFRASSGTGTAGVGAVRAKTGTLSQVNAMAGVVRTADGRTLAFALVANGVTAGQWDAQAKLDAIAAALARCGCR